MAGAGLADLGRSHVVVHHAAHVPGRRSRELVKLALHNFKDPSIIGDNTVVYEVICPGGFTEPAATLLDTWPSKWLEPEIRATCEDTIAEFEGLAGLTWDLAKDSVLKEFPKKVKMRKSDGHVLTRILASCISLESCPSFITLEGRRAGHVLNFDYGSNR
jgi:hypothetical protein